MSAILAMGFATEYGFDWSVQTSFTIPSDIAKVLELKTKENGCCGTGDHGLWPDKILIIRNGDNGPVVIHQYHAGLDYPKEGQTHFVDWKENHVTPERL